MMRSTSGEVTLGRKVFGWGRPFWRAWRVASLVLVSLAAFCVLAIPAAGAQPPPVPQGLPCAAPQEIHSHAWVLFCVPPNWNHNVVLFAHGYRAPGEDLAFQNLNDPLSGPSGTTTLPALVLSQGYAFAATTFRENGLAIRYGVQDMVDLRNAFRKYVENQGLDAPEHVYATGVSEGGLVVTLLAERHPDAASGGLAACAPIGSFKKQLDYFGDFRVLFDVFFPGVLQSRWTQQFSTIPQSVIKAWSTGPLLKNQVLAALQNDKPAAATLIGMAKVAVDPAALTTTVGQATLQVLDYNIVATNDAIAKLGGNPFSNLLRWYSGSGSFGTDLMVNQKAARFAPDWEALEMLARDDGTSGDLKMPLVSLQTTGDDVVPSWQQRLYAAKVLAAGRSSLFTALSVNRWGHCTFTAPEVLSAFNSLVAATAGSPTAATGG